ncbi:hypothetical protein [Chroococcidiopsis sp.]|uniref:hypothetical protein n=1 Tax=Chroococcidiopsis sp. TaxID=3088168 RepID=UPI003F370376
MDLSQLEIEIQDTIKQAEDQTKEFERSQKRKGLIEQHEKQLLSKVAPIHRTVSQALVKFEAQGTQNPAIVKLVDRLRSQKSLLEEKIRKIPQEAELLVDEQMQFEQQQEIKRLKDIELENQRRELKQDILEEIGQQRCFFEATDLAIYIRDRLKELSEINAVDEIAIALVNKINELSNRGPVAKHRLSGEETIRFTAQFALNNRIRAISIVGKPTARSSKPQKENSLALENPSRSLSHLKGRVVIVGGDSTLELGVRAKLGDSQVEILHWANASAKQSQINKAVQAVEQADLVIAIAGVAPQKSIDTVVRSARSAKVKNSRLHAQGVGGVINAIEVGLASK